MMLALAAEAGFEGDVVESCKPTFHLLVKVSEDPPLFSKKTVKPAIDTTDLRHLAQPDLVPDISGEELHEAEETDAAMATEGLDDLPAEAERKEALLKLVFRIYRSQLLIRMRFPGH